MKKLLTLILLVSAAFSAQALIRRTARVATGVGMARGGAPVAGAIVATRPVHRPIARTVARDATLDDGSATADESIRWTPVN